MGPVQGFPQGILVGVGVEVTVGIGVRVGVGVEVGTSHIIVTTSLVPLLLSKLDDNVLQLIKLGSEEEKVCGFSPQPKQLALVPPGHEDLGSHRGAKEN